MCLLAQGPLVGIPCYCNLRSVSSSRGSAAGASLCTGIGNFEALRVNSKLVDLKPQAPSMQVRS